MSQIILPSSFTRSEPPAYVCNVPHEDGSSCGASFFRGQELAYTQHVRRCLRGAEEAIHELSPRTRLAELWDSDKELERYAHEHSAEILEGRKRI